MHYTIYLISNTINNKIYIGMHKTKNINDNYYGSGKKLNKDIKKYGRDKFIKTILFECSNEKEMKKIERVIVNKDFVRSDISYNVNVGGHGSFDYINSNKLNNSVDQYMIVGQLIKIDSWYKKWFCNRIKIGKNRFKH